MQEYRPHHQLSSLVTYCSENTGFTLSVAYLLLTLCGIFYADRFYAQFDVPYLKLAETSDLLIIGISEPAALLMFGIAVLLTLGFDFITRKTYLWKRHWQQRPPSMKRRLILWMIWLLYVPKYKVSVFASLIMVFVLYGFVFVTMYAEWHGDRVKSGHGDQVLLTMSAETSPGKQLLLGSTANYLFTYNNVTHRAHIYSVQNVTKITPAQQDASQDR